MEYCVIGFNPDTLIYLISTGVHHNDNLDYMLNLLQNRFHYYNTLHLPFCLTTELKLFCSIFNSLQFCVLYISLHYFLMEEGNFVKRKLNSYIFKPSWRSSSSWVSPQTIWAAVKTLPLTNTYYMNKDLSTFWMEGCSGFEPAGRPHHCLCRGWMLPSGTPVSSRSQNTCSLSSSATLRCLQV